MGKLTFTTTSIPGGVELAQCFIKKSDSFSFEMGVLDSMARDGLLDMTELQDEYMFTFTAMGQEVALKAFLHLAEREKSQVLKAAKKREPSKWN